MKYRAEIDGLRAVAVVSVILYHAKIVILDRDWFEGGFIGVDIFFVISGYLLTRIILLELTETNTLSFIKFYERRARRILPMLFVVIAVSIPFAWQKLLPQDLVDFAKSALTALGFGSNFFFYFSTTEYGAGSSLLKPLLHTWSLGVEEQFYFIIPIIVLLIWKFSRRTLLPIVTGMLLMSIFFADVMEGRNAELNFFLPFSRFWEFLVGSALALIELKYGRTKNSTLDNILSIVGLILVVCSILFFDSSTSHPSFQTLIPVAGVALLLTFCSTETFVGKLLSLKPMVGIGLISYSLYLWHFPIFAFGRIDASDPSTSDKLSWIALALSLSILSYFIIEKPFRNRTMVNVKLFCYTVLVSLSILVYVNYYFISKDGHHDRLPEIFQSLTDQPIWNKLTQNGEQCYPTDARLEHCIFNKNGKGKPVFLVGDSVAASLAYTLKDKIISKGHPFHFYSPGSSWYTPDFNRVNRKTGRVITYFEQQNKIKDTMLSEKESIVILSGWLWLYFQENEFWEDKLVHKNNDKLRFEQGASDAIYELLDHGHIVVLVYPIPTLDEHLPKYLLKNRTKFLSGNKTDYYVVDYTEFKIRERRPFTFLDSMQHENIYRVYPHLLFCDQHIKGKCVTHDEENIYYADSVHPSVYGSGIITDLIIQEIGQLNLK